MLVYAGVGIHFYLRARATLLNRNSPSYTGNFQSASGPEVLTTRPVKVFVWSLSLATLAIIIRGIYRTAELAQGWNGFAISHEVFTIVLDVSDPAGRVLFPRKELWLTCPSLFRFVQAIPMVICMALLVPAHPYFVLPNQGRARTPAEASPFADDATMTELHAAGPKASKQSV